MKRKKTNAAGTRVLATAVLLMAMLMSSATVSANQLCDGVAFMPTNLVLTRAQD